MDREAIAGVWSVVGDCRMAKGDEEGAERAYRASDTLRANVELGRMQGSRLTRTVRDRRGNSVKQVYA